MNTKWSSHLKDAKERKSFEEYVSNCNTILERLTDIVSSRIDELEVPKPDYDSPSWGFKQADRIGQVRAYKEILKLTQLK